MKNYIIISILTTIVILLVVYLGDYIKGIYSIEDFENANANGNANANTNGDIKTTYERLLEARRTDFYEKKSPLTTMKQEESLNLQTENYRNGVYDKYSSISDPIGDEFLPYTIKNYKEDPAAISKNNMNQYTIINVYKNTLDRQPTDKELNRNLQDFYENDIDEELLKLRIYNSTEYKIITNMQSNDIKPELITNISKGQLADKLKTYYKDQHNTILTNTRVLDVLIKCYIHFQFNDYLFKAMLMHDKYMAFENRVRTEYIVSDKKILDVFNETFLLSELRLIANELKRQDILKRKALQTPIALYNNNQSDINSSNINMGTGKHISDIVRNSDNVFNINIMVNDDKKTSMPFSKRPQRPPQQQQQQQQQATQQQLASQQQLATQQQLANQNILNSINNKNSEAISTITNNAATIGNIGNIATLGTGISTVSSGANISNTNVVRDVANTVNAMSGTSGTASTASTASGTSGTSATSATASGTSGTSGTASGASGASGTSGTASTASSASTASGTSTKQGNTYVQDYKEYKDNYNSEYGNGDTDNTQYEDTGEYEDTEATEQPMRIYNPIDYKYHYRGEQGLPRPNVCSYGTKQIVQPIFLNSSGTDLREAAENTQVGSIMPKFEYYEYEDTI
jgi:predicted RNA-binding protein with RPS1 domain